MANPYAFGTRSAEIRVLQQKLNAHDPPFNVGSADGIMGKQTRDAVQAAQEYYGDSPADGVVRLDLLVQLGVASAPATKSLTIFDQIGALVSIFTLVKGLQMDTANVDVKSSWLSTKNWAAVLAILTNIAAFFHIGIPPDLGPAVLAVVTSVTALYILVKNTWFSSTITAASAKKLT